MRSGVGSKRATELAELDNRHLKAIELLAEGESIDRVASEIGIDRRTLYRWRTSPVFMGALAEAQKHGLDAAKTRMAQLRERAVDAVEQTLTDPDAPYPVKLKAAEMVLDRTGMSADALDAESEPTNDADMLDAVREFVRQNPGVVADLLAEAQKK